MREIDFLRYRLSVIERMPETPHKVALKSAVLHRMAVLEKCPEDRPPSYA